MVKLSRRGIFRASPESIVSLDFKSLGLQNQQKNEKLFSPITRDFGLMNDSKEHETIARNLITLVVHSTRIQLVAIL